MASLRNVQGRKDSRIAQVFGLGKPSEDVKDKEVVYTSGSDSDTLSLEARNEKDVQQHPDQITPDAQDGVQKAEAAALVWGGKGTALAIYAWIWVCLFMLAFQSSVGGNVLYYAYSKFDSAPQIAVAGILAQIVGGVLKLPIAKVLNVWGRAEGLLVFFAVFQIGIIILATCTGPNSYAAGYTIYWVGYDAIYLILDVFIADTSGLRNRAFAFAFVQTPFICTAFTGPLAAQRLLAGGASWRWAYGIFAIVNMVVYCPLAFVFKYYESKAKKQGLLTRQNSGRTTVQSIVHYIHEFDVIGALLLMAAFILFLLPFSMASYGVTGYKTPKFIAMVVIGVCLFPVFAIWEKFFARVHFIRWELFKQRTVLGACCTAAILFFSFYCWDLYYYYFVEVVFDLSIAYTGYMTQIYNIGSCFWGVVFGVYIRYTKHFKYACLFFGLPLMFLGAGLLIHYRGVDQGIAGVIGAQICIAFAGGTLVIGEDIAVMASADRDGVPLMLSLVSLSSSLGGAIGYAVAAAINSNVFPGALRSKLPAATAADWDTIYIGGATTQLTYLPGTPTRTAIDYAWGQSQRYGSIAATCVLVLAIPAIAVWKNYNVDKKQNKGAVF